MLCLFALSMVLSAWALPPDEKKVTLDLKDVPMETFLNTVKQKAGINMLYNSQMFKGVEPVTVKATNEPWKELLDRVLSPKGFTYATKDGIVVIKKKDQKTRTLEGKVVDEQGGELPGVTVLILGKERNIGTMTDADGAFSLGLPEGDVTIRLSFVGMQTLEIHTGKLNLDKVHTFKLKPDSKQLEEVVVTGYVKISKNSFTGTSVTVTADQLMSVSKTNVLGALQTFDPSFRIAENNLAGSNPNNVPELYIRGRSGIGTTQLDAQSLSKTSLKNNPNLPTFIMDGFEISVQKLYDMDPSRIESITILKDAAATAMYGSRAANGVVIITTVTPKAGKVNIDYNFTGTLEYPDLTDYNMMNAREKLETEVAAGMFKAKPEAGASEQNRLDQIYNRKLNNVVRGVDTYWLSKPLRTVFNHKHSLYLDGGTDDLRWGADFSYNSGDGVMKGSYRDRMSGGLSLSYRFGAFQVNFLVEGFYTRLSDVFVLENIGERDGILIKERRNGSGAKVLGLSMEGKMAYLSLFQLQAGVTLQQSRYDEPEKWSETAPAEKKIFRTPNTYGYFTATYMPIKPLSLSLSGTYTGSMLVQHMAGYIDKDVAVNTRDFFDMGVKVAYDFKLYKSVDLQLSAGVQNVFNAYQNDFDQGVERDSGYIYGPAAPRSYFAGIKISY